MGKDISEETLYSSNAIIALDKSIDHWSRICCYVENMIYTSVPFTDSTDLSDYMMSSYGEDMYGHSCPLCKLYEGYCDSCILNLESHPCDHEHSVWYKCIRSESLEEFLLNAQEMRRELKRVRRKIAGKD